MSANNTPPKPTVVGNNNMGRRANAPAPAPAPAVVAPTVVTPTAAEAASTESTESTKSQRARALSAPHNRRHATRRNNAPKPFIDKRLIVVFDLDETIFGKFPAKGWYGYYIGKLAESYKKHNAANLGTYEQILKQREVVDTSTAIGAEWTIGFGFCPEFAFFTKIKSILASLYLEKQRPDSAIAAIILYSNNSLDFFVKLIHETLLHEFNPGKDIRGVPPLFDVVMAVNSPLRDRAGDVKSGPTTRDKTLKGVEVACDSLRLSTHNLAKRTFLFDDNETTSLARTLDLTTNYIQFFPDDYSVRDKANVAAEEAKGDAGAAWMYKGCFFEEPDGYKTQLNRFLTIANYLSNETGNIFAGR